LAEFPLTFSIPFAGGIWFSRRFRRVVVLDELGGVLLLLDRIKEWEGKIHPYSSYVIAFFLFSLFLLIEIATVLLLQICFGGERVREV
jgi:hypothetical protein